MNETLWLILFYSGIVAVLLFAAGALGAIIAWSALVFRVKQSGLDLLLVPVLRMNGFEEKAHWLVAARNRCYLCASAGLAVFAVTAIVSFAFGYSFGPN